MILCVFLEKIDYILKFQEKKRNSFFFSQEWKWTIDGISSQYSYGNKASKTWGSIVLHYISSFYVCFMYKVTSVTFFLNKYDHVTSVLLKNHYCIHYH